jgi:hypothetical protein
MSTINAAFQKCTDRNARAVNVYQLSHIAPQLSNSYIDYVVMHSVHETQ